MHKYALFEAQFICSPFIHRDFAYYRFFGNESVTYTTHSDPTFLDNLVPLTERWKGPVSVAIYAPGSDFDLAMGAVEFYRTCLEKSHLIRDYVTFHFFSEIKHFPENLGKRKVNCSNWSNPEKTYKAENNLTYPVNVGRNIARDSALTHFVLPSDIELYPNPGMIESFLKMVTLRKNPNAKPKGYVVSIFEIEKGHPLPETKKDLLDLMKKDVVIPFHKRYCPLCHAIPGAEEWVKSSSKCNLLSILMYFSFIF